LPVRLVCIETPRRIDTFQQSPQEAVEVIMLASSSASLIGSNRNPRARPRSVRPAAASFEAAAEQIAALIEARNIA